jgi:hypothetical protein
LWILPSCQECRFPYSKRPEGSNSDHYERHSAPPLPGMATRSCLVRLLRGSFVSPYLPSCSCLPPGPWLGPQIESRDDCRTGCDRFRTRRFRLVGNGTARGDDVAPSIPILRCRRRSAPRALYAGLGYVFCRQLDKGAAYSGRMGAILTAIVLLALAVSTRHSERRRSTTARFLC